MPDLRETETDSRKRLMTLMTRHQRQIAPWLFLGPSVEVAEPVQEAVSKTVSVSVSFDVDAGQSAALISQLLALLASSAENIKLGG